MLERSTPLAIKAFVMLKSGPSNTSCANEAATSEEQTSDFAMVSLIVEVGSCVPGRFTKKEPISYCVGYKRRFIKPEIAAVH